MIEEAVWAAYRKQPKFPQDAGEATELYDSGILDSFAIYEVMAEIERTCSVDLKEPIKSFSTVAGAIAAVSRAKQ